MQVITANAFASGEVLYWATRGWVDDIHRAQVFADDGEIATIISDANAVPHQIVGVYAIAVTTDNAVITPVQYREKIRATGPTNYEHGKSATGVIGYVSL